MKESNDLDLAQSFLNDAVERVLSPSDDEVTQRLRMAELRAAFFALESAQRLKELQYQRELTIEQSKSASNETRARLEADRTITALRSVLEQIATADEQAFQSWREQDANWITLHPVTWLVQLAKDALRTGELAQ